MTHIQMNTQPVGVGLVGAGAFGVFCLEAFALMPEIKITAVADIDAARAQTLAAKYGAAGYGSLDALLVDANVEIVALNTPPHLHGEQGLAVLQASKHLFCEKPLALTVDDGERLIQAAQANHALLTVDYVMRRNPFWATAAALRESGVIGALRHMDLANHAAGLNLPTDHWFWDKAKSGGIWIEHGVHFFDAFAWVAGQTGEIIAAQQYHRADGANDRVEALAHYGEVAAHFYHGFDQSGTTEQTTVTLTFEHAYIMLREWVPTAIEILTTVDFAAIQPYLRGTVEQQSLPDGCHLIRAHAPEGKSLLYRACIQDGLRDLASAIRDPGHTLTVTGEHGLHSLQMATQAEFYTSA